MAVKTNKSYTKRIKVSKNGKLLSRTPGQNHFNAKEARRKQLGKKGKRTINHYFGRKAQTNFLPHQSINSARVLERAEQKEANQEK